MNSKNALVTGASRGVGLATSKELLKLGYSVDGIARDFSKTECEGLLQSELDLSDIDALAARLQDFKNVPDVLMLNAGFGQFGGIEQFSYSQIQSMVNTNLVSNLFLLKYFLPLMKANGGGDIVLVGSESAVQGAKAGAVYCATKFAIRGLAQSLRADCSTADIRVILVNPGPVDTGFFDDLSFTPQEGRDFVIDADSVASTILNALAQPRNVVLDEINMQPLKRSFRKK